MRQRFLPVLLAAALLGCSKSDSNPIVDFGEGQGFSYRTGTNLPVGFQDPTDWTADGDWNKQERALFPDLSFDLNGSQQPSQVSNTAAYPNPSASGQASWGLYARQSTGTGPLAYSVQAVLVNRNYQVMKRLAQANFSSGYTFMFDYAALGVGPNELYRLYYVVYNTSGLVYKGHGDVRYSPQ